MLQPVELRMVLPIDLSYGAITTTANVWNMLAASHNGNLQRVQQLINECPGLAYAQYNYTPPIHFAVREGHIALVRYLLQLGALDPGHITYPFNDNLLTMARDRDYYEIATLLEGYLSDPGFAKYKGENGAIHYNRSDAEKEFETAVDEGDLKLTEKILKQSPEFVHDQTFFWSEGILMMPAKDNNLEMAALLIRYGATVPLLAKWAQYYYFKHYDMAVFLLDNGMSPHHRTWHEVSLLHDMAQKGDVPKASLLLKHGAEINKLEEEYQSTPLGMAARWGHTEMVEFLLDQGADVHKSGAPWSAPLAWAKKKNHTGIATILMNAGASAG